LYPIRINLEQSQKLRTTEKLNKPKSSTCIGGLHCSIPMKLIFKPTDLELKLSFHRTN